MAKFQFNPEMDFPVAAGLGLVSGVHNYTSFGVAFNLAADTPRDLTNLPVTDIPLPANAGEALEIVSDDIGDTALIQISALGPNAEYLEPFTVQLNGTTPVALPGSISRINGADSVDPDGFDGNLNIQQAGAGTVFATLDPEDQQLNQALYTVPANRRWVVGNLVGTMQKSLPAPPAAYVVISLFFKAFAQTKFRRAFGFGLQQIGDTAVEFNNKYPSVLEGPVDIKLRAESDTAGANISGLITGLTFDDVKAP